MAFPHRDLMTEGFVDPELIEILSKSGPVDSLDSTTDIVALRTQLSARKRELTQKNSCFAASSTVEVDVTVETRDCQQIKVRIYNKQAQDKGANHPALVMLHGGGWVLGGLDNEALLCRRWCETFDGISFNVDYRLAPEYKFPIPVFDCHDAVLWVAKNAAKFGANLASGFILGGVSAGANMAAVISHLYRDDGSQPALTGLYLSIPSLMSVESIPPEYKDQHVSATQNRAAPILNAEAIRLFRRNYQPDNTSPLMSPVLFASGHRNLPRTYFQICGMDPLRDDSLIYDQILRNCGVETKVDIYPGLPHGFWSWWPESNFTKRQQQDSIEGLAWLLG